MQDKYLLKKELYFSLKSFADSQYGFTSTASGGLLHKPMNQPLNGVAEIPQAHVWNLWSLISPAIELVGPWNLLIRVSYIPNYKTAISDKNHMLGRWTVSFNMLICSGKMLTINIQHTRGTAQVPALFLVARCWTLVMSSSECNWNKCRVNK